MGYYTTALSGGYMIGNSASGLIAAQWGYGGALASAGVWSLLAAALALGLPPVIAADPARARAPRAGGWAGARRAFGDPGLLYAGSVAFLLSLLFHVPGTFFPLYGLGASLAVVEIGFIRTAYSFTNTAVRGFCGAVLERVGRPQAEMVAIVCQVAALAVVPLFNAFGALLACLVFVAFWRAVGLVANTMSLAEDVDPRRVGRGVASGVFNAANDVGGLVAPALGGLVAGLFGLENVFRALPGLVLLSYALVVGTLGRTTRRTTMGAPVEPSRS
jgi:MFS family permease